MGLGVVGEVRSDRVPAGDRPLQRVRLARSRRGDTWPALPDSQVQAALDFANGWGALHRTQLYIAREPLDVTIKLTAETTLLGTLERYYYLRVIGVERAPREPAPVWAHDAPNVCIERIT